MPRGYGWEKVHYISLPARDFAVFVDGSKTFTDNVGVFALKGTQ
jgi:hypothetical protein